MVFVFFIPLGIFYMLGNNYFSNSVFAKYQTNNHTT